MKTHNSYWRFFTAIYKKDLTIAFRQRSDFVNPLLFFVIVISLFPLAVGPEPQLLARIAPGIIWVAALLSILLNLDKMFRDDYLDGTLEQIILSPFPSSLAVLAKITAHWTITSIPLVLMTPVFALMLNLESKALIATLLTLLVGTPLLSFIGAIGAALTVSLQKKWCFIELISFTFVYPCFNICNISDRFWGKVAELLRSTSLFRGVIIDC